MSNGRYSVGTGFGSMVRDWEKGHLRHASGAALGEVGDPTPPGTISGLTLSTYTYRDSKGGDRAHVDATWTPITVIVSEDGDPDQAKVTGYLVSSSLDGAKWTAERTTTQPPTTITNLPLNSSVTVRVRAQTSSGSKGPYATATIVTAEDKTPPPKPSAPILTGVARGVQIKWDGKDATGAAQPSDFKYASVHLSNGPGFTPSAANKVHEFGKDGGQYTWTDDKEGSFTYYARVISHDYAGNASVPSNEASATTQDAIGVNTLVGGGNLLKNSSFERVTRDTNNNISGVQDWVPNAPINDGWFLDASNPRNGAYAIRYTLLRRHVQECIVPPGSYIATCYVRSSAGATSSGAGVAVEVVSGNAVLEEESRYTTAQTAWVRSRVRVKVTSNATLRIVTTNGTSVGDWFVDSVQFEEGDIATAWSPQPGELKEGQVTSFDISDYAVGEAELQPNSISTQKLQSGSILADKIASGEVTTSKLTITNISNLIADPSFELESVGAGQTGKSWGCGAGWSVQEHANTRSGKRSAVHSGGTAAITNSVRLPVVRGEQYTASAWISSQSAGGGQGYVRLHFYDRNDAFITTYSGNVVGAGSGYARSVATLPSSGVPTNAAYMTYDIAVISGSGTWWADDCQLRRLNEGELIVDGSVSATKIAAGAITTDKLTVGSVSTESLVANPSFEDAAGATFADKWYRFTQGGGVSIYRETGGNVPSGKGACCIYSPAGAQGWVHSASIPVIPGEGYYLAATVRQINGSGGLWVGVSLYTDDPGDTEFGAYGAGYQIWAVAGGSYGSGLNRVEAQIYIPSGYRFAKISLLNNNPGQANYSIFDDLALRRVTGSTMIEDGAITTGKVMANAIRANHILAGEVSATHITAAGINAEKITSGRIMALELRTGYDWEPHIRLNDNGWERDALRWYGPNQYGGVGIRAEIRGNMDELGGGNPGVFINGTCMIGNTSSVINQFGRRVMSGGDSRQRVRGGTFRTQCYGGYGYLDIYYGSVMEHPPTFIMAQPAWDSNTNDRIAFTWVRQNYHDRFQLVCRYRDGGIPGDGTYATIHYYVEKGF